MPQPPPPRPFLDRLSVCHVHMINKSKYICSNREEITAQFTCNAIITIMLMWIFIFRTELLLLLIFNANKYEMKIMLVIANWKIFTTAILYLFALESHRSSGEKIE